MHPQYPHFLDECSQGSQRRLRGRKNQNLTPHPQLQQPWLSSVAAGRCWAHPASRSSSSPLPPYLPASAGQCLGRCSVAPACRSQPHPCLFFFFLGPGHTQCTWISSVFLVQQGLFKQLNEMQLLEQPQLNLFV